MNQTTASSDRKAQNFHPIKLLERLSDPRTNGYLEVSHNSVQWRIDIHQGQLIYATHSIDPFERLERHLRRLSHQIPQLTAAVRTEVRLNFDNNSDEDEDIFPSDY
jgi:two-component system, chemotaxis family, response regulator PixG